MDKTFGKYQALFIYAALAIGTFAVFWQVYSFEFLNYDDMAYVTRNEPVKEGLSRDSIIWAFTAIRSANWHPLTWLSHMLDCQLFGLNPGRHHLINLLLHITNTLLLFAVLKSITGASLPSAFVAAVFALHPIHVESVAWIAERKDVLSTLFWILTMAAYSGYVRAGGTSRYLLTLLVFALGLMAKPMLVTLPFVLLLLDYWPFGRIGPVKAASDEMQNSAQKRVDWYGIYRLVHEKIPFFALSAISSVITFVVQQKEGAVRRIDVIPLTSRLANALVSYVRYIGKLLWPSRLAVIYPFNKTIPIWQSALAAAVLIGITVFVIRLARRHKYLAAGWLWYLGTLIPVIGLVQVGEQAMADRYMYVPAIGLFIMAAWGSAHLLRKQQWRKVALGISMPAVLLALSVCTHLQLRYWRNSTTLFERAIEVTEDNTVAHYALGYALFEDDKVDEAIVHFEESLRINPGYVDAHNRMGLALMKQDKLAEAVRHFSKALILKPDFARPYFNLGWALARQNNLEAATTQFKQALALKPDYPEAQQALAKALIQQGKFAEAAQLAPDSALLIHEQLAAALAGQGKFDQAIEHYTEALRLKPNNIGIVNNLAWFLAAHKEAEYHNPEKAVRFAEKACELTGYKQPETLDTLSVAYAAAGRFGEAAEMAEKAIKLAEAAGKKELAGEIQNRLKFYKTGLPYAEE